MMIDRYQSKEYFEKDLDVHFKGNDVACFPGFHFHDYYEVYYCEGGAKQYLIEDNIYSMDPGDLFIINDFEIHKPLRDKDGDYRRIIVILNPEKIKEISPRHSISLLSCFVARKWGTHNKIHLDEDQRKIFKEMTRKIYDISNSEFGSQALAEAYYIELLVYINRWFNKSYTADNTGESYGLNATAKAIIDYLNDNFTSDISLDSLSEEFHLNKHYMCQIFKQTTDTTIHRYVISRRLARAKILLHQGHNVTTTSDLCGFKNYTNFIRAFKQHFGTSPKQFADKN